MDVKTIFRNARWYFYLLEEMNKPINHFRVLWLVFLPFWGDEWAYRPFSGSLGGILRRGMDK